VPETFEAKGVILKAHRLCLISLTLSMHRWMSYFERAIEETT